MQKSVAYEPHHHSLTLIKIKQNYGFKKLYQARASSPVFSRCYSSGSQCSPDAMDPAHPDLLQKLAATGYGKNCKEFTPMQVSYILYFLGEP